MSSFGMVCRVTVTLKKKNVQNTVQKQTACGVRKGGGGMGTSPHCSRQRRAIQAQELGFGVNLQTHLRLFNTHSSLSGLRHQINLDPEEYLNTYISLKLCLLEERWKIHQKRKCVPWDGHEHETTQ